MNNSEKQESRGRTQVGWLDTQEDMGNHRNLRQESHDPGGGTKPGGARTKVKASGVSVPGRLD